MTGCELQELRISALLDGEADLHEQAAVMDHLLGCSACRRFYREARAFQAELDGLPLLDPSRSSAPAAPRRRGLLAPLPGWAQAAAALLLLALGVALGAGWGRSGAGERLPAFAAVRSGERPLEVRLASNAGGMSEGEFVALTIELLRADSRYQRKMLEVLRILELDDFRSAEGGLDYALDRDRVEPGTGNTLGVDEASAGAPDTARRAIY